MHKGTVVAALSGTLLALALVGAFLALDRTTLHWYTSESSSRETAEPAGPFPAFSEEEVLGVTEPQIEALFPVSSSRDWLRCYEAEYHSQNSVWVVTCGYYANNPQSYSDETLRRGSTRSFVFDDDTGRVMMP